jgi:hypothetical protein
MTVSPNHRENQVEPIKNSQLIRQLPDESHVIYGPGH